MSKQLIWEVYDNYRTVRLNVKYYAERLEKFVRWNMTFEIGIAISAPGSVVSGLWFLKNETGIVAWQCIAAVTAILAFLKPFFRFTHQIKKYEQTLSGYRSLDQDLYEVTLQIKNDEAYSPAAKKMFAAALKKMKILVAAPPERKYNTALVAKLVNAVNEELPKDSFYFPKEN